MRETPPVMSELGIEPGTVVGDAYRIERALGAGAMGVVVLAHDLKLARNVAIKFVRPELIADPKLRALFVIEAQAMARVSHPNVVTIHSFGDHRGAAYFVMGYVDGGSTVEHWLGEQNGRPHIDEALRIIEQACLGVEAIHAASTVHRDLKPSNLLMDAQFRICVSDLGVARILENATPGSPSIVGSAAYMAPEAVLGKDVRPEFAMRRDTYALGCIAFELLTGRLPFVAPHDMGLMAKHLLETVDRPSLVRPGLAEGYDAVLARALDKDPHKRWPSVAAFRRALERVRSGELAPERILIADDDPDWRVLLLAALASRFPDAQIDTVSNGEEALELFEQHPYSVVLCDLEMPEMDGMGLTSRLRSLVQSARTPIIVLTAAGGPGEWRRLSSIGADGFLVKPIEPDDVVAMIRRTMKKRG